MNDIDINKIRLLLKNENSELKKLIEEIIKERNVLLEIVNKDELTRVNNRRILNDDIKYDVVAMCDIDNFKQINDKYGHLLGDKVLIIVSKILTSVTREDDFVCRYGGDEFAIILNKCSSRDAIRKLEDIRNRIVNVMLQFDLDITISIGLTEYKDGKLIEEAIKEADSALYYSKQSGKNRITMFESRNVQLIKK